MKRIANSIMAAGILLTLVFSACKKADSEYKQYVRDMYYPGKVLDAEAQSGKDRVKLSWRNSNDPNVVKVKIFWNNYADTIERDITPGTERFSIILEPPHVVKAPLEENSYYFIIRTYDDKGNASVPVEVAGKVYGKRYENLCSNRRFENLIYNGNDLLVEWAEAEYGEIFTILEYTDKYHVSHELKVEPEDTETLLPNFNLNELIYFSAAYLPEPTAIDTLYANREEKMYVLTDANRTNKLKNTHAPFSCGTHISDNCYYTITDWTVENGYLNASVRTYPSEDMGIYAWYWMTPAWGWQKTLANVKIYQTIELDPGTYRFDISVNSFVGNVTGYIVANAGSGLPNTVDVATASSTLGYASINSTGKFSAAFTVTAKSFVSLGIVANVDGDGGECYFTQVELWQTF